MHNDNFIIVSATTNKNDPNLYKTLISHKEKLIIKSILNMIKKDSLKLASKLSPEHVHAN